MLPAANPTRLSRVKILACGTVPERPFRDVSLTMYGGCLTAIVGPSGSGKTSFLMCLNRLIDLIPQCRVAGKLFLGDLDVLSPQIDVLQLRRRVGMIFQKPNPFPMSIRKNLEFPLKEHGVTQPTRLEELVQKALMDVGIWTEVKDRLRCTSIRVVGRATATAVYRTLIGSFAGNPVNG